ncbi:MAG: VOC family protein [Ignavibacteriaceae bacterium]|jgi:predicted enzyme related to lactoylglutathione lyase
MSPQIFLQKIKTMNIITSIKLLTIFSIIFVLLGCEQKQIIVPPITKIPTGEYHTGKIVWHDLLTDDVESVKTFYGGLFGWKFDNSGDLSGVYTTILLNGEPIGGIVSLEKREDGVQYASQWMEYISTNDVDKAASFASQSNCKIIRKPFDIMNRGRLAIFTDPQGALIAVVNSATGDPVDKEPDYNNWLWNELLTDNINESLAFYKALFGYETELFKTQTDEDYYVLRDKKRRRAGVIQIPFDEVKPNWLPFIAVVDPGEVEEKAKTLGGTIILGTEGIAGKNSVIIADPSGAVFAVTMWPLPKEIMDKLNEKN